MGASAEFAAAMPAACHAGDVAAGLGQAPGRPPPVGPPEAEGAGVTVTVAGVIGAGGAPGVAGALEPVAGAGVAAGRSSVGVGAVGAGASLSLLIRFSSMVVIWMRCAWACS
jgi:hypothetical protein